VRFLESVLKIEVAARLSRQRMTLARLASFPAIKTLDGFDFETGTGVPKAQIQELEALPSSNAARTWCCWDQAALAKHSHCHRFGLCSHASRHQGSIHHGCRPVADSDDCAPAKFAWKACQSPDFSFLDVNE